MRLFVAAWPSAAALADLADQVDRLAIARYAVDHDVNVRLSARERWHVTLAFLGETPGERASDAMAALSAVAVGAPASLRVGGGGRFGRGRFTILWAGLRGDTDGLDALAVDLRKRLRRARLEHDRKPFRPHLTIGRPGDRAPAAMVKADIATLNAYEGPDWTCDEISLVRSFPGPKPRYETIGAVKLA